MRKQNQSLEPLVANWLGEKYKSFFDVKSVPRKEMKSHRAHAKALLEGGRTNPHFQIFFKGSKPAGLFTYGNHYAPRIKNQQLMEFYYDPRARREFLQWLKPIVRKHAAQGTLGTNLNFVPGDEKEFIPILKRAGGYISSEILAGDIKTALKAIRTKKNPPRDLSHLGLELKPVTQVRDLTELMKLQRRVGLQAKEHVYFSYLKDQLEKDRTEYEGILKKQMGLILGVYSKGKLVGAMITTIIPNGLKPNLAGMSFFLDKSIQGRGVVTTGYLHLLEFLAKRKIKTFVGGTSQPAVQGLGKLMKRTCRRVSYIRMKK